MCFIYLLSFLDKQTLNYTNAKTAKVRKKAEPYQPASFIETLEFLRDFWDRSCDDGLSRSVSRSSQAGGIGQDELRCGVPYPVVPDLNIFSIWIQSL